MKRFLDIVVSITALTTLAPIITLAAILIWLQDGHWPFYSPWRVGRNGKAFRIFKLRSMVVGADRSKVDTTTDNDGRITRLGHWIRRFKVDELPQFANVFLGQMSVVGPRPNIDREVQLYSPEERRMLSVRPGITDLSSIVFSDLGTVLSGVEDANIAYNQLVRPWKSRLALFYVDRRTITMDIKVLWLTFVAIVDPERARLGIVRVLNMHDAPSELISVARRDRRLEAAAPPGLDKIVTSRGN